MIANQLRAARGLLHWSVRELSAHSGVSTATITRAESGTVQMTTVNVEAIRAALDTAGVVFIPENGGGAGVRLRKL